MSETIPFIPEGMTLDEYKAFSDALGRQAGITGGGVLASALTNVAPDPALPGVASYVPFAGGVERLLGFVGSVGELARMPFDAAVRGLGLPVHSPPAPAILDTAGKHAETLTKSIYDTLPVVPQVDPNSPADVANYALGTGLGAMAPIAPATVFSGLPSTIGKALQWIVPTTEGAAVKTAIGGTLGAVSGAMDASDVADANTAAAIPAPAVAPAVTPESAPQQEWKEASLLGKTLSDASAQYTSPPTPAVTTTPAGEGRSLLGAALAQQPVDMPAPTFGEQGESGKSLGRVLLEYAAITAGVAAGVFTHRVGSAATEAGRTARMNNPRYAQAAADYNNARIAQRTSGEISSGISPAEQPRPPMPVSNPVQAVTTKLRGALLDANATPEEYIRLHADNPAAAERLVAEYGLTHNHASWDTRIQEFNKTGRDFVSGESIPAPTAHQQDVARLSTANKKVYMDTRAARNELNNRTNNRDAGMDNVRHDFPQYDDAQLKLLEARGMNDPVIAELVNRSDEIMNGMIRIGRARGFFPEDEAGKILARHPNYLSEVDVGGKISHPLGPRNSDPYTGISQVTTPVWSADAQHIEAMYRQFELNEQARMMIDRQLDTQAKYPTSAKFVEKITAPISDAPSLYTGGGARDPMITVRSSGGTNRYRVDNPDWMVMASGENANKQRIAMNSVGIARRLVSQMTTGAGAVLSGRAFPVTHIPRTMISSQLNLPRNRVSGLSDMAMRKVTGGYAGQRYIPDPTFLVGAAYSSARSAVDDLALQMSNWLRPNNRNLANRFLRSTLTPNRVDLISKRLEDFYLNTTTHEMKALGISGAGNMMTATAPAFMSVDGTNIRLASNSAVPELFMVNGTLGRARPFAIRLRQAAQQILTDLNDAGNEYIYRLNRFHNPNAVPEVLGRDVRRMMGDPGEMGSSSGMQAVSNTLPYFNISTQGTRAAARAFTDAPVHTSIALVTSLGSLAALSLLTAMRSKAHMDHLENTLNTQQRAASPTFYTDPDPTKNIQISLPQEFLRSGYAIMLDVMSKAFNTTAAMHHEGAANDLHTWLKDFLSQHVENSSLDSFLHGITDMTNFVDVPPLVNAFVAATGNTLHITDWNKIYNDIQAHQFGFDTFVQPVGGAHTLPNQAVGDSILDGENGKRLSTILSNVFGLFGGSLDKIAGFDKYYAQTHDFWSTLGYVGRDWLQGMRDINPSLNTIVWENQARSSVRPPIVDDVENTLRSMKVTQGGVASERYEGMTGAKGLPVPDLGQRSKVPTDPVMRDLWFRTAQSYKFIEGQLMPQIKAIEGQMGAVNNQAMNVQARREWMNARTRDKADKYKLVKAYIDDLNADLSRQVGKHVNVARIDWSKGPEQFHD